MTKRRQVISTAEAKPCKTQHKKPCSDCPFARTAVKGWLGGYTVDQYLALVHMTEKRIDCHTKLGPQCAGAGIYRSNTLKDPRSKELLVLPADKKLVFATPAEFKEHHEG
jgi:F420-0:gamma-glutamyl ligase